MAPSKQVHECVLTTRDLNRALLARQLLLERADLPLVEALERVGGLQTQYAPAAYIALATKLARFELADLTQALERRAAVQATLMRSTIHVVSAADYWPLALGLKAERQAWWERTHSRHVADVDMVAANRVVATALEHGPLRRTELVDLVRRFAPDRAAAVWGGMSLELVRVPPSGTWERRRADLYATAEGWLGPPAVDEADGRDHLLRRYLGAFGPAPLRDAASWAGVRVGALRPSIERLELRRFRDEAGTELLDLRDAPLAPAETPAPARFLPAWDATLLVHARRTLILPEHYRRRIFSTKTPHSFHTFLVDGAVAGTWRWQLEGSRAELLVEPFERLPHAARREVEREGERLLRVLEPGAGSFGVRYATP